MKPHQSKYNGSGIFGALPPAASKTRWQDLLHTSGETDLKERLAEICGAQRAHTYASWAGGLYDVLRNCADFLPGKDEVIVPSYLCGTFVYGIRAAGLKPVFYDLQRTLLPRIEDIRSKISSATLAVLAVNNVGVFSDLAGIRSLCDASEIFMIEDATYTFGGSYKRERPAGSLGHAAVLNFSEGKALPVGGGAVLINSGSLLSSFKRYEATTSTGNSRQGIIDRIQGAVYRAGTSRIGYSAYYLARQVRSHKAISGSKGRITFEKARRVGFAPDEFCAEIGEARRTRALAYLGRLDEEKHHRQRIAGVYEEALSDMDTIELPSRSQGEHQSHWIRFPVVCRRQPGPAFSQIFRFGVTQLYGPSSPYRDERYPESCYLYDHLITLPTHHKVTEKMAAGLVSMIVREL